MDGSKEDVVTVKNHLLMDFKFLNLKATESDAKFIIKK